MWPNGLKVQASRKKKNDLGYVDTNGGYVPCLTGEVRQN